ncbi:hypothetical protein [Cysteiniphilum sp. 6C5]|uniref:hypothetical protein n=1 Tax=unclassified Cysteiniphilum TaxID=2610889 RepID=UPI003F834B4E
MKFIIFTLLTLFTLFTSSNISLGKDFKLQAQETRCWCAAACIASVVDFLTDKPLHTTRQCKIVDRSFDPPDDYLMGKRCQRFLKVPLGSHCCNVPESSKNDICRVKLACLSCVSKDERGKCTDCNNNDVNCDDIDQCSKKRFLANRIIKSLVANISESSDFSCVKVSGINAEVDSTCLVIADSEVSEYIRTKTKDGSVLILSMVWMNNDGSQSSSGHEVVVSGVEGEWVMFGDPESSIYAKGEVSLGKMRLLDFTTSYGESFGSKGKIVQIIEIKSKSTNDEEDL